MIESSPTPRTLAIFSDLSSADFVLQADRGFARKAASAGWRLKHLETASLSYPSRLAFLKQQLMTGTISAAAFVHLQLSDDQAAIFRAAKVPLGYLAGALKDVDSVLADDAEGAYQATRFLIDLGHKRIAVLAPPPDFGESFLRVEGFKRALAERSLGLRTEYEIVLGGFTEDDGAKAAEKLLKLRERPTAVFVPAGDLAAKGLMQAIKAKGLNIPRDISVLGYDDLPMAEALEPPLSSVRQPLENMAARLAEVLIEAVLRPSARPALQQSFDPELVPRLSTGVPPRH